MPNDAKLGLVLGVGLVIAVAVLFFRRDGVAADLPEAAVNAAGAAVKPRSPSKSPIKIKPTAQPADEEASARLATPNELQPAGGLVAEELPTP